MKDESFGSCFQNIRKSKDITQDQVAQYVHRKKMTISLIENNKNEPPSGELLKKMIESLSLTDEKEISKLYLLASKKERHYQLILKNTFFLTMKYTIQLLEQ